MLMSLVLSSTMITVTPLDSSNINRFPVVLPLIVPIAILVLPLLDLIMAVVRRTSNGLSPFAPDRGHLHHRLLDVGHSHRRSVLIMYTWNLPVRLHGRGAVHRGRPARPVPADRAAAG